MIILESSSFLPSTLDYVAHIEKQVLACLLTVITITLPNSRLLRTLDRVDHTSIGESVLACLVPLIRLIILMVENKRAVGSYTHL